MLYRLSFVRRQCLRLAGEGEGKGGNQYFVSCEGPTICPRRGHASCSISPRIASSYRHRQGSPIPVNPSFNRLPHAILPPTVPVDPIPRSTSPLLQIQIQSALHPIDSPVNQLTVVLNLSIRLQSEPLGNGSTQNDNKSASHSTPAPGEEGRGSAYRFCFEALARITFVRKVLLEGIWGGAKE